MRLPAPPAEKTTRCDIFALWAIRSDLYKRPEHVSVPAVDDTPQDTDMLSSRQQLIHSSIVWFLVAVLSSCQGFRLSSSLFRDNDPFEDAILLGLDGTGEGLVVKRSESEVPGMWFGPRLGRREKRSADEAQEDSDGSKVEEIVELLRETPWALVPLKGGKRHTAGFIPRLGRDSNEDDEPDYMEQRSPPFAPRLGRRLVPFRPRLGRDHLPHDVYSPRLGRSVHEKKQPPVQH
ncbi:PBAN-type neuropeptides-like [Periplaneta americana]